MRRKVIDLASVRAEHADNRRRRAELGSLNRSFASSATTLTEASITAQNKLLQRQIPAEILAPLYRTLDQSLANLALLAPERVDEALARAKAEVDKHAAALARLQKDVSKLKTDADVQSGSVDNFASREEVVAKRIDKTEKQSQRRAEWLIWIASAIAVLFLSVVGVGVIGTVFWSRYSYV